MDHLLQFIGHHWALCAGAIVVFIAIIMLEARTSGIAGGNRVTPQVLTQLMNREQAIVVDIRDTSDFRAGHIVGAVSMPIADWETRERQLEKYQHKPVILVDTTGQKSQTYATRLAKADFKNVKILGGGVNAWLSAKLPLVRK